MSAFTPSIPLFLTNRTSCPKTTPCMSAQRPHRSNRRPPKRQPSPQSQSDSLQFFSEDPESEQLSDVDDGFFSRYTRDREPAPDDPPARRRMDRETAASAFDAVDKLFGSLKAEEKGQERRKWLDDVQARAATLEESSRKDDVLDVDSEDVERDEFSEAKIEDDHDDNDDNDEIEGGKKSGFKEQKDKAFAEKYSFDMLMKIARKGPAGNQRKADPRNSGRDSRQRRVNTGGEKRRTSDFSHLLGLTKRIIDRKDGTDVDDYEPIDDEMEKTIEFRGAQRKDLKRRQKFTAVRRIGGQSRKVFIKPDEWLPLTEDDVESVKSDHRSFGNKGRDGKLKGVVAECHGCRGTGLDTCVACLGAGWIQPLSDKVKMDDARREILEEMWSRPNLVVDTAGEAQCMRCNGVGKQFCKKCQGSGSALRKGFSFSERDEVFGMFVNVEGGEVGEEEDAKYDDDDDDDDEEEDEEESFQLYQGSGETFDFKRKKREEGDGKVSEEEDDEVDVDDVIEVEDESSELLAALEAMHLADIEERKTGKRPARRDVRIRRIADDEDDEDDDDVDDVDDVDVDVDVGDDDEDSDDDDDDYAVSMGNSDTEDLADLDDDDEDYEDIDEEDMEVDMRFSGEDDDDDDDDGDDDDVNEENFNGYD